MKIIITGGAGFIGSNLTLKLQELYPEAEITVIDNFLVGHFKNLIGFKGNVITKDIREINWDNYKADIIFHQAAITDTTVTDQKLMMEVNTEAFKKLLNHCIKNNIKLIYASSAATYGLTNPPMTVGLNEKPANIYGFSKLIMDNIVRQKLKQNPEIKIIGLRYFNVYGPRESFKGKMSSMIFQLRNQILKGNPRVFTDGNQKRDFIYVKDVVQANIKAINAPSGIYNVGTGISRSFNEILNCLKQIKDFEIEYFDCPFDFYQKFTEANKNNFVPGYEPKYTLEQGIEDYLNWLKQY